MYDIQQIDKYIAFLRNEAASLRKRSTAAWAEHNAVSFEKIAELLRTVRQAQQMQGMDGKHIGSGMVVTVVAPAVGKTANADKT